MRADDLEEPGPDPRHPIEAVQTTERPPGLAIRHGITLLNSPGTIDSDYRGEVMVMLINLGAEPVTIERGERIAQIIVAPVVQATLVEMKAVSETERGAGGFGSTGSKTKSRGKKPAA